jgi:hypothetical protein
MYICANQILRTSCERKKSIPNHLEKSSKNS